MYQFILPQQHNILLIYILSLVKKCSSLSTFANQMEVKGILLLSWFAFFLVPAEVIAFEEIFIFIVVSISNHHLYTIYAKIFFQSLVTSFISSVTLTWKFYIISHWNILNICQNHHVRCPTSHLLSSTVPLRV